MSQEGENVTNSFLDLTPEVYTQSSNSLTDISTGSYPNTANNTSGGALTENTDADLTQPTLTTQSAATVNKF